MEMKDWIQIIAEIVGNGVVLAIFGKWLALKFNKVERKEELHSSILKMFYDELINLNKNLIEVNVKVQMKKISDINKIRKLLEENVLTQWIKVITLYDTYEYELKCFGKEYNDMGQAWKDFSIQTTPQGCGEKLELFKIKNKKLMEAVNKSY